MEAKPNESGVSGDRQERGLAASTAHDSAASRENVARPEEDRAFLGTDNPAFWIKEHGQG
jgi:hypothetical protein